MKAGGSGRDKSMPEGTEAKKAWHIQGTGVLLENNREGKSWKREEGQQMGMDR